MRKMVSDLRSEANSEQNEPNLILRVSSPLKTSFKSESLLALISNTYLLFLFSLINLFPSGVFLRYTELYPVNQLYNT